MTLGRPGLSCAGCEVGIQHEKRGGDLRFESGKPPMKGEAPGHSPEIRVPALRCRLPGLGVRGHLSKLLFSHQEKEFPSAPPSEAQKLGRTGGFLSNAEARR